MTTPCGKTSLRFVASLRSAERTKWVRVCYHKQKTQQLSLLCLLFPCGRWHSLREYSQCSWRRYARLSEPNGFVFPVTNKKTQQLSLLCLLFPYGRWHSLREYSQCSWRRYARLSEPNGFVFPVTNKKTQQLSLLCLLFPYGRWHSLRESNPQLALRRGLLYPFN